MFMGFWTFRFVPINQIVGTIAFVLGKDTNGKDIYLPLIKLPLLDLFLFFSPWFSSSSSIFILVWSV